MNQPRTQTSATPEWQQPLTDEKIAWLLEKFDNIRRQRPGLFLPYDEYWDA